MQEESSEPLLPHRQPEEAHYDKHDAKEAGIDIHFATSLWALLKFLKPYTAPLLSILAVLDVLLGAQVGKVTGNYYRILLDKEWGSFWRVTALAALIFAASTAVRSTQKFISEMLAIRWRSKLTSSLTVSYLRDSTFYNLETHCDNPDQRMVQDASQLCSSLGLLAYKAAATPFKIAYYSIWVWSFASWLPLLVAMLFFVVGAFTERLLMGKIASIVCQQEALEGNLRFAHTRVKAAKEQVALWGGLYLEQCWLDNHLSHVISMQKRLAYWRWGLSACTTAFDYTGAILNYGCVALPIALGFISREGDSGRMAQRISNASFATLSLIYSLTEILDLSDLLATLAGLTARVSVLMQCMGDRQQHQANKQGSPACHAFQTGAGIVEVNYCSLGPQLEKSARQCFRDAPDLAALHALIIFQTSGKSTEQSMDGFLEYFVHFQRVVKEACQNNGYWYDAADPRTGFAMYGQQASRWNEVQAAHSLLGYPVVEESSVCPIIRHPRFGTEVYISTVVSTAPLPLLQSAVEKAQGEERSPPQGARSRSSGSHWANGSQDVRDSQEQPPVQKGRSQSPSSQAERQLKGNESCLREDPAVCNHQRPTVSGRVSMPLGSQEEPVLVIEQLSCNTGSGQLTVRDLNLRLGKTQSLLIQGQSGVGKTTLLRAFRGLWPLTATVVAIIPKVMFVSQLPLLAPGPSLADQLTYPSGNNHPDQAMLDVLQAVGLYHLLQRLNHNLYMPYSWEDQLSVGELQRLACARVLLAQPLLAFMDEPFNALGKDDASQLMAALMRARIALVVTSQLDSTLQNDCDLVLTLLGDGAWSLA